MDREAPRLIVQHLMLLRYFLLGYGYFFEDTLDLLTIDRLIFSEDDCHSCVEAGVDLFFPSNKWVFDCSRVDEEVDASEILEGELLSDDCQDLDESVDKLFFSLLFLEPPIASLATELLLAVNR